MIVNENYLLLEINDRFSVSPVETCCTCQCDCICDNDSFLKNWSNLNTIMTEYHFETDAIQMFVRNTFSNNEKLIGFFL